MFCSYTPLIMHLCHIFCHAGGGTVSATVRSIFADPWPEDIMASLMHAILRRLISAPAAATYLLGCANAVAMVCPSRVKHEQLHQLWDTCLRCVHACICCSSPFFTEATQALASCSALLATASPHFPLQQHKQCQAVQLYMQLQVMSSVRCLAVAARYMV